MQKINIIPIVVALGISANAVSFEVLTLPIPPTTFKLNARFFNVQEDKTEEVSNVPFELPLEDYNNWQSDTILEDKCLTKLGLKRNGSL